MRDTDEWVERKARQLFSAEEFPRAMALLNDFGTRSYEREAARVRLALLKLSGGDLELLRQHLQMAHTDYRDVLAGAEYPLAMRCGSSALPVEQRRAIARQDREQYLRWLGQEK